MANMGTYPVGGAMAQWQQRRAYQAEQQMHEHFHSRRSMQDDADEQWRIIRSKGWSTRQMQGVAGIFNQAPRLRDCEYCGSTGSITDHGKGLMKCANCGAS